MRLDGRTGNLPSSGLAPDQFRQPVRLRAKDDSLCTQFGVIGRGCIAVFAHPGDEEDDR
jgi:hypothetical protein